MEQLMGNWPSPVAVIEFVVLMGVLMVLAVLSMR